MNIGMFSVGMKYFSSLAASGPWGIGAMIAGLFALLGAAAYGIGRLNKAKDESDLGAGGADAGVTAQTLKNQAEANRAFEIAARKEFDKG